jgi:uncharacterized membrane protein
MRGAKRRSAVRFCLVTLLVLAACSAPQPPRPDGGIDGGPSACDVVLPTECSDAGAALDYSHVKPALDTHCANCHYGALGGPWPLKTYNDVVDWAQIVRDSIANCTMPPEDGGTNMTKAEKQQLLDWLRCGYPR